MNYVDRLILIAILGGVAGFLLFLLRRIIRQEEAAPRAEDPSKQIWLESIKLEQSGAANVEAPTVAVPPPVAGIDGAEEPQTAAVAEARLRKRKPTKPLTPAIAEPTTPIVTVLDMLKQKDTLAAAFVLREILAPPVSKRR